MRKLYLKNVFKKFWKFANVCHRQSSEIRAYVVYLLIMVWVLVFLDFFFSRTERDATNWSSDKLKSLLLGLSVENQEGMCEVTEVSKVEGEASINNRKGKLIFFYEWNLKATWTGELEGVVFGWILAKTTFYS